MQNFATPAPISAVVEIPAGRVQLIAADRADTTVEVRPTNPAKNRDVQTAEQTTVTFPDGVLQIRTAEPHNKLVGHAGSVEVTVQLPAGSALEGKSDAAELRAVGRLGDVAFDGAYQQIKVDEAETLRLTSIEGYVEVGRLTGPAEITTARGDIRVAEAANG